MHLTPGIWESLWIDVIGAQESDAGDHTLTISLCDETGEQILAEQTAQLRLHAHRLPPLSITNTHWFHADSLST